MSSEINISALIAHESFEPWQLSNSRANLGDDAGRITWRNSLALAHETAPAPLDTEEKRAAFRDFVQSSGGWTREEIDAWPDVELNALFVQWVAGDIREAFGDVDLSELTAEDWSEYEADEQLAHRLLRAAEDWSEYEADEQLAHRLFRAADGQVYFYIGE